MNAGLWVAASAGWVVGLCTGRVLRLIVLTYSHRKGGAAMLRNKTKKARAWIDRNFLAIALVILALSAGMTAISVQLSNAAKSDSADRIAAVAVCTGEYLAADAKARDERAAAVKPRDDAEAHFIKAVAALRGSDGSDPKGDKAKAAALFAATDEYLAARAKLDKIRAVDYPAYTCAKPKQ